MNTPPTATGGKVDQQAVRSPEQPDPAQSAAAGPETASRRPFQGPGLGSQVQDAKAPKPLNRLATVKNDVAVRPGTAATTAPRNLTQLPTRVLPTQPVTRPAPARPEPPAAPPLAGDRFAPRSSHPQAGLTEKPTLHLVPGTDDHFYASTSELDALLEKEGLR